MSNQLEKDKDEPIVHEDTEDRISRPNNLLVLQYLGYGLLCLFFLKYLLFVLLVTFSTLGTLLIFILCGAYFIKIPKSSDSSIRLRFPKLLFTKAEVWNEEVKDMRLNQASMSSNLSSTFSKSIDEISNFILRDFVESWFKSISSDPSFPNQVRVQLKLAIAELESRLYLVDVPNFLVLEILPLITEHFNNFVSAEEIFMGEQRNMSRSSDLDFKITQEYGILHPAISQKEINKELEIKNYSRSKMSQVVRCLLSHTEQSSSVVSILVREIITNSVLSPIIQLLSDPDFWSQTIVKLASATLKDRDQVRELRSAIDKQYNNPNKPLIPTITKNPLLDHRISPNMRQPEFEKYLKAIDKSDSLNILKQLKYYLAVQISRTNKIQSNSEKFLKYCKRLHLARNLVDKRLESLGSNITDDRRNSTIFANDLDGFITSLSLSQLLSNPSSLSFFMEFMEQRSRTVLLQYWLTVNGIKDPLEDPKDPDYEEELSSSVDMNGAEDVKQIFHRYFDEKLLRIKKETYQEVQKFVDGSARNLAQYVQVRKLILMLQEEIFHRMEDRDLPDFKNSELFLKLLSSESFEESLVNEVDLAHEPSYEDFENEDDDLQPTSNEHSLEDLESALSDIMSKNEIEKSKKPPLQKSDSSDSSKRISMTEGLKNEIFGSSDKGFLTEKPLFDESEDDDEIEDDDSTLSDSKLDVDPEFFSISHDFLNLKEEIDKLEKELEKLSKQSQMLDPLILKAELTNNTNELRILRKSKASYEREIEAKGLQKQQLIVQDNDNSLFGKTTVSIQSWVKGRSHGKDYILYVIEVQKSSEGKSGAGWIIGRRFSQFYKLNELLRKKYPQVNLLAFPKKKIILKFQQKALIDQRRYQLEHYLKKLLEIEEVCSDKEFRKFLTSQDYKVSSTSETSTPRSRIEDTANKIYNGLSSSIDMLNNSRVPSTDNLNSLSKDRTEDNLDFSQNVEKVEDMQKELENFDSPIGGIRPESQKSFIKPVTDLVIALFSLNRPNSWLRGRAIIVVLHQIFGSTIEKHIKDLINGLTNEDKILESVNMLRDIIWPNGKFMESGIPRTNKEKNKSKQEARVLLETLMIDTCSKIVGQPSAKSASNKIFSMTQNETLNRNLVYEIFDKILVTVFPEATST